MENIKNYIIAFNGIFNLAVLGFIIHLLSLYKKNHNKEIDIVERQKNAEKEDRIRIEKWAKIEQQRLIQEKDEYKYKFEKTLQLIELNPRINDILKSENKIITNYKAAFKKIQIKIEKL